MARDGKTLREKWADPEWAAIQRERLRQLARERWASPEQRRKMEKRKPFRMGSHTVNMPMIAYRHRPLAWSEWAAVDSDFDELKPWDTVKPWEPDA